MLINLNRHFRFACDIKADCDICMQAHFDLKHIFRKLIRCEICGFPTNSHRHECVVIITLLTFIGAFANINYSETNYVYLAVRQYV